MTPAWNRMITELTQAFTDFGEALQRCQNRTYAGRRDLAAVRRPRAAPMPNRCPPLRGPIVPRRPRGDRR